MKRKTKWYKKMLLQLILLLSISMCGGIRCYGSDKEYEYDDSGRLTKVTYEDGSYETYEYDKNGNIVQITYMNETIDSSGGSTMEPTDGTEGAATSQPDDEVSFSGNIDGNQGSGGADNNDSTATESTTDNQGSSTGDKGNILIPIMIMLVSITMIVITIRKSKES